MSDLALLPAWKQAESGYLDTLERAGRTVHRTPPATYPANLPAAPFTFKVVGVTFSPGYPDNLSRLADLVTIHDRLDGWDGPGGAAPLPVLLVARPDNPHDANAVEVHAPALAEWAMIGYVPAGLARRLSPDLQAGHRIMAHVVSVLVSPGHEAHPGISVEARTVTS